MMVTKVLAERIEQNLEGMSKQLAKEVVGLEEVQKLQQVTNSNGHNLDDDVDGKECGWFEADPKEGKCKFMVRQNSGIEERRSGRRRWQEQRLRGKKQCNRGELMWCKQCKKRNNANNSLPSFQEKLARTLTLSLDFHRLAIMEEEEGQVAVMVEETYERLDNVSIFLREKSCICT